MHASDLLFFLSLLREGWRGVDEGGVQWFRSCCEVDEREDEGDDPSCIFQGLLVVHDIDKSKNGQIWQS